ncbi:MAG: hypothetical protein K6G65_02675 [Lachnospiraceae bacterium]|nr:hypothetical protein [Lachnospiraceae bacterium]
MEMSVVMGAIILICIFTIIFIKQKKFDAGKHYDEMQLKIRGDGYRLSYFVTVMCMVALSFGYEMGLERFVSPAFGIFATLMLGIVIFPIYCIVKEVFFPLGQKGRYYIVLCAIVVVINGGVGVMHIMDGTVIQNGKLVFEYGSNLVCAAAFAALLITLACKTVYNKRRDDR